MEVLIFLLPKQAAEGLECLCCSDDSMADFTVRGAVIGHCAAKILEVMDILPVVACKERPENVSDSDLCAPFSEEEVSTAISQMKSGKAPGIDNISAELLKIGGGGGGQLYSG